MDSNHSNDGLESLNAASNIGPALHSLSQGTCAPDYAGAPATKNLHSPNTRTISHRAAVALLQEHDDTTILAWTQLLRSLTSAFEQRSKAGILSHQQINAIATLRGCPDEAILSLLRSIRQGDSENHSRGARRLTGSQEQSLDGSSSPINASSRHRPSVLARQDLDKEEGGQNPETSCRQRSGCTNVATISSLTQQSGLHKPTQITQGKKRPHGTRATLGKTLGDRTPIYWCTICEHPSPIRTCDGWKRHEKEQHEKGYVCMPTGPVEVSEKGHRCAFCGLSNPDRKHLDTHGIILCVDKPIKDRRFTRKFQLTKHLEVHGILNGDHLADSWQVRVKSKYYSCGFCVSLFTSNSDRLNHIDVCHFRHFQAIEEWDPNIVIRGLLLQPAVLHCWTMLSLYDVRNAALTWEPSVIGNLRSRLEGSYEPPQQLAMDAYNQLSCTNTRPLPIVKSSVDTDHQPGRSAYLSTQSITMNTSPTELPLSQASSLSWDHLRTQAMDLDNNEIHPPQILATDSYIKSPDNDATTPYSLQSENQTPEMPSLVDYTCTDATLASSDLHYPVMPDYRQASTINSVESHSLASTHTSMYSQPMSVHDQPRMARDEDYTQQQSSAENHALTATTRHGHRKSPSFVSQLRTHLGRRLSRVRLRDGNAEPDIAMDIELYDVMRIMEHDPGARANANIRHEAILYGESPDRMV
ncbi:hypothetical protein ACLMJK_001200 [Lecanora helva]